jgi:predicted nucleic acid-binding protein
VREAISNTSPLFYLYRIDALEWLPRLFAAVSVPDAVAAELKEGQRKGYDVPDLGAYTWVHGLNPRCMPSEWLTRDLGAGELAAIALALENPDHILLLDDRLARQVAQAAGLEVWGTLRIILEAKQQGITDRVDVWIDRLRASGMWISEDIERRILALARESK